MVLGVDGACRVQQGSVERRRAARRRACVRCGSGARTPEREHTTAAATESAAAAPSVTERKYAIVGVAANDVLNVREKPDAGSKKV
jgi:hypothetical protein